MTERELDQIIDGALESYVADPVPGLEGRVIGKAGQGTRPTGFAWLLGGFAAAAVLAVMWMPQSVGVPQPAAPPVMAVAVSTPAAPGSPAVRRVWRQAVVPVARSRVVPLSPEERQLLEFARSHPELFQKILADVPVPLSEPLSFERIVIKPLEIPSVGE